MLTAGPSVTGVVVGVAARRLLVAMEGRLWVTVPGRFVEVSLCRFSVWFRWVAGSFSCR